MIRRVTLLLAALCLGCSLQAPEIKVTGERSLLETQMLGRYQAIQQELWIQGSLRELPDSTAERGQRAQLMNALRRRRYNQDDRVDLLARGLPAAPPPGPPPGTSLRRAHHQDRRGVLAVDHAAFEPFWRLDDQGLTDALAATPSSRFRVATNGDRRPGDVLGYAVVGRASSRGYVQRLAVAPGHHRAGLGRALLLDGLRWLERRRVLGH